MSKTTHFEPEFLSDSDYQLFVDELAEAKDRESFNAVMKRFNDYFISKYKTSNNLAEVSQNFQTMPQPPIRPLYSSNFSSIEALQYQLDLLKYQEQLLYFQQNQIKYQQDPRTLQYPQEFSYGSPYNNTLKTSMYKPSSTYIEDLYGLPLIHRANLADLKSVSNKDLRNSNKGLSQNIYFGKAPQGEKRSDNLLRSHEGFMRVGYVPFDYNLSNYFGGTVPNEQKIAESNLEIRKNQETILQQTRNIENVMLGHVYSGPYPDFKPSLSNPPQVRTSFQ